jgi:N-acetylglucosamine kinase-like BadF-type ATPase
MELKTGLEPKRVVIAGDLLLGVEGGHCTEAIIATADGRTLGRGLGPPSNHHRVGIEESRQALTIAIEGAFAQVHALRAGRGAFDDAASWAQVGGIGAACFGLSGVDSPQDEALYSSWLMTLGCSFKYAIVNDSELTLSGGTPEGWGVGLISSTGSICVGRRPSGQTLRVGGWGHVLGDEGSGYAIAAEALKLATQAADGRGGSPVLLQAALHHWKLAGPQELIGTIYGGEHNAEHVASFAGRVVDLAGRNDPAAREIVDRAATALALHVDTVIDRLGLKEPPLGLGGVMMRILFKKMILERVKSPLGPVAVVSDPLHGALATARRLFQTVHAVHAGQRTA